jgi:predicted RNA-binding Zn-ribbon protein involved in translation (DUF1610 family)
MVMGQGYGLKCSACDYNISVTEGVGMMYSPNAVFFGRCDDPSQNWSIAFPDGYCERDKPLLLSLVKNKKIINKAMELLANGAMPDDGYEHELYCCPKCMRLANKFYFRLVSLTEKYEPDYQCSKCKIPLRRVVVNFDKDWNVEIMYKNNRKVKWKCPECGNEKLVHSGELIMWD